MIIINSNDTHTITVIPTNQSYNYVNDTIRFEDKSLGHVLIGLNGNQELELTSVWRMLTLCVCNPITCRFLITWTMSPMMMLQ